jgi:hypothetical protein
MMTVPGQRKEHVFRDPPMAAVTVQPKLPEIEQVSINDVPPEIVAMMRANAQRLKSQFSVYAGIMLVGCAVICAGWKLSITDATAWDMVCLTVMFGGLNFVMASVYHFTNRQT